MAAMTQALKVRRVQSQRIILASERLDVVHLSRQRRLASLITVLAQWVLSNERIPQLHPITVIASILR